MSEIAATGWHARALSVLTPLFALAVAVSVVHYTDNFVNYDDFPQIDGGPNPARWTIPVSWVVFTAAGVAGYLTFRRIPSAASLALLAFYSGSGLIGFGHYAAPGAFDMPPGRQAHVVLDILCGLALFAFVLWAAVTRPQPARWWR